MFWFVTWTDELGQEYCQRFNTVEKLFAWMQDRKTDKDMIMLGMSIYRGECLFDGS